MIRARPSHITVKRDPTADAAIARIMRRDHPERPASANVAELRRLLALVERL